MTLLGATPGVGDTVSNGLETYVILEQIRLGMASNVYRVICKSGRLRNRHLALKKLSSTSAQPHFENSLSIHTALHHPNIVSMFSAFRTQSEVFYVLELCSVGSLSKFLLSRSPSTLLETELRGVIRSLVDALVYLKKELVIHCNINSSNILLTNDYGIKLSGFDRAIRLQAAEFTVSNSVTSNHTQYLAPEIISGMPFSFPADIWSVGCVMIASLSGTLASNANAIPDLFLKKSQEYAFYGNLSSELKCLITSVLQVQPEKRLSLPNILSHAFLAPNLRVKSLRPASNVVSRDTIEETLREQCQPVKLAPFPPKPMQPRRLASHSSIHPLRAPSTTRSILRDIVNTDLRNLLCNEITTSVKSPLVSGPTRRIVSDPIPCTGAIAEERKNYSNNRPLLVPSFATPPPIAVNIDDEETSSIVSRLNTPLLVTSHGSLDVIDATRRQTPGHTNAGSPMSATTLPIGTTRPMRFNTSGLNSQTHKTAYGQVTILPSHALLVDFRESQRRKGLKGDEVIRIDSDGSTISVYSAPHLSTPCCLVEPIQQFSVDNLPSTYWKQYNDAGRLINQIKQRTPKMVVYTMAARCTLMANIPRGDIELSFNSPITTTAKLQGQQQERSPYMRIRFSRQGQSMELSRRLSNLQGEEWIKKSLSSTKSPPYISTGNWTTLDDIEREAIHQLVHFVRTCEAVEGHLVLDDMPMSQPASNLKPRTDTNFNPLTPQLRTQPSKLNTADSTPTFANSLSLTNLPQRPPKLATSSTVWSVQGEKRDNTSTLDRYKMGDVAVEGARSTLAAVDPAEWCVEEFTNGSRGIQTRFLPSVGWCIRYGSSVSQGGRYRIMFLDGIALDIDVDEDWVELRSESGDATRYRIRDSSNRKIGARMKVFEEFISLFDDSQTE